MGTIQNGKIVLDASPLLPDGTRVVVGYKASGDSETFTLEDIKDLQTGWVEAYPGEMNDILASMRQERDNDIEFQTERDDRLMRFINRSDADERP